MQRFLIALLFLTREVDLGMQTGRKGVLGE